MTGDILTLIGVILLLVLASAFFSSAETALTAASDARMRQLAGKGNKRARLVEKLRDDREGLIGEAADVLFHLLVMLKARGVSLDEVMAELARRQGQSGIAEKASRGS